MTNGFSTRQGQFVAMDTYYNENDPKAAAWLRALIDAGMIARGFVDERSILDVLPSDLAGFGQCHFFAGIGGWSRALRLAGVPDDFPIWTGSCPCQPFSAAGKGHGFTDERHLWPAWFHLIDQCRPSDILGEQVASKDGLQWFDLVSADLEGSGYAVGATDMCAAGIGAPHIRQRLWFYGRMGDTLGARLEGLAGDVYNARGWSFETGPVATASLLGRLADTHGRLACDGALQRGWQHRCESPNSGFGGLPATGPADGFWRNADWLRCRDEKWRAVEPGTFPLVDGLPARMGLLRGYGNAIVPPVAQAFIEAVIGAGYEK
jgi:DNA (cytosine-5)-methyltransferase 1